MKGMQISGRRGEVGTIYPYHHKFRTSSFELGTSGPKLDGLDLAYRNSLRVSPALQFTESLCGFRYEFPLSPRHLVLIFKLVVIFVACIIYPDPQ